jgi:hypothetical protein
MFATARLLSGDLESAILSEWSCTDAVAELNPVSEKKP